MGNPSERWWIRRMGRAIGPEGAIITMGVALLVASLSGVEAHAENSRPDIDRIDAAIAECGARWTAGETSVTRMSPAAFAGRLADVPDDGPVEAAAYDVAAPIALPSFFDWRQVNGGDYTTPIRDQGDSDCGNGAPFAVLGAMESAIEIQAGDPSWNPDLSEQALLSCHVYGCEYNTEKRSLEFLEDEGTTTERCLPMEGHDGVPCSDACVTYDTDTWSIDGHQRIPAQQWKIKARIYQGAPVIAAMQVFEDFPYYTGGIYEHTFGLLQGHQSVVLVGWNDAEGCWIARNSWGTDWGEDTYGVTGEAGWFRIAYGEAIIEHWIYALKGGAVNVPACTCEDADSDGHYPIGCGDPGCGPADDCDDTDPDVAPGMPDLPHDGIDNDCDGIVDSLHHASLRVLGDDLHAAGDVAMVRLRVDQDTEDVTAAQFVLSLRHPEGSQEVVFHSGQIWLHEGSEVFDDLPVPLPADAEIGSHVLDARVIVGGETVARDRVSIEVVDLP